MIRAFFNIFLTVFLFSSCAVSYPKETLHDDIKRLVKKESGLDCAVTKINTTIYLDMEMNELISTDQEVVGKAINAIQTAVFTITRVALSSDDEIKIIVVSAYDPDYNIALKMFQNIDDVKSYFYQRISRGDYEQRQLLEIQGPADARMSVEDKHHVTQEEYVARLTVSQINMTGKKNPVLGSLINNLQLRYGYIKSGILYIFSKSAQDFSGIEVLLKKMISNELVKNLKKYSISSIKSAIILTEDLKVVFEVPADLK